tara:strand:- start:79 stop:990 length:912 start_codon:yes stop_codon:yes gene_type:complete
MKRVLGIIILGLLFSVNAYAEGAIYVYKNYQTNVQYIGDPASDGDLDIGSNAANEKAYKKCLKESVSKYYCLLYSYNNQGVYKLVWQDSVRSFENSCIKERIKECEAFKNINQSKAEALKKINQSKAVVKKTNKKSSIAYDTTTNLVELILILGFFGAIIFGYLLFLKKTPTPEKIVQSKIKKIKANNQELNLNIRNRNIIEMVWNGDESMSKTFWLYCVFISAVVAVVFGTLSALYGFIFFIVPVIYIIWSNIGLWNSSNKYRELKLKKKQTYGWATTAKVYVILNFITTLSQAGFILRGDF